MILFSNARVTLFGPGSVHTQTYAHGTWSRAVDPAHVLDHFLSMDGVATWALEYYVKSGELAACLCLRRGGKNRAVPCVVHVEKMEVNTPSATTMFVGVGVDDRRVRQAIHMLMEDPTAKMYWIMEQAFKVGENPLPFMRSVFGGVWSYRRGEVASMDCVTWNGDVIWSGKAQECPADCSKN